jgi:hypothetical protein
LRGEVAQPGTYSRRTIAAVKLLSKEDAERFTRFCGFLWHIDTIPPTNNTSPFPLLNQGGLGAHFVHPEEIKMLDSMGFVRYGGRIYSMGLPRDQEYRLRYFDHSFRGPDLNV